MTPKTIVEMKNSEQSDSNETPDIHQKLGGSINNNSTSEASTATSSTGEMKTGQLNDIEFELAWETRDKIVIFLSKHTKLLSGLVISADVREMIRKLNGDLVATLMNLPPKADDQSRSFESPAGNSADFSSNEVVLDLSWNVRQKIVDTLMTNHNIALLGSDSVTNECKTKLINQNNDLVYELLKLNSRTVAIHESKGRNLSLTKLV